MTGKPSYSPAEILDMGRRAEFEGNVEYATQFYTYLIESLPGTREASDALVGMERLAQLRDKPPTAAPPRQTSPEVPTPPQARTYANDGTPRGQPHPASPRLSLNGSPKPGAAQQGAPHHRQEPSLSGPPAPPTAAAANAPRSAPPQTAPPFHGAAQAPQAHWNPVSVSGAHREAEQPLPRMMQPAEDTEDVAPFVPGYRFGRFLAFVMILFGWLALIGGIAFAGLAVAGIAGTSPLPDYAGLPLGIFVGISAFVGGLVLVFLGSLAQAAFEAANNTRELLDMERAKEGW